MPPNAPSQEEISKKGDQGDTSLASDPHRVKGDLVMLRRALKNRWPVKSEHQGRIVERLMDLIEDADPKIAASAVRTGVAMVDANIRIDQEEDKADRLDAGKATERVEMPVKVLRGIDGDAL